MSKCSEGNVLLLSILILNFLPINYLKGISIFLSLPHFLNADHKFIQNVEGMRPEQEKHDHVMHFEPVSKFSL